MTLTDREIAILHLALKDAALAEPHEMTVENLTDAIEHYRELVDSVLAKDPSHRAGQAFRMVPLYRHAFGIEAPGERHGFILSQDGVDVTRFDEVEGAWTVVDNTPPPSPASLAIANALSRTRS